MQMILFGCRNIGFADGKKVAKMEEGHRIVDRTVKL